MSNTPETDALYAQMLAENPGNFIHLEEFLELACRLERERDEAREAMREMWQSGDAFLPYIDNETTSRWRKTAGWEETK